MRLLRSPLLMALVAVAWCASVAPVHARKPIVTVEDLVYVSDAGTQRLEVISFFAVVIFFNNPTQL